MTTTADSHTAGGGPAAAIEATDGPKVPLLDLRGITKTFPGVRALNKVTFDVYAGEVHALCGENGAGKSTLIKVMTGAHAKDEGRYLVDGREVELASTEDAIALGISCVYQELSIAPQLDLAENLFIGNLPTRHGVVDYKTLYRRAAEILDQLHMDISPRTLAGDLPLGRLQMVEIGRALTRNARAIIMDEPTSSLSATEVDTLFGIIRSLTSQGIAVVYISHKLGEVMQLADRVTVIRDGENVVTFDRGAVDQDHLVSHMIGRSLGSMYSKRAGRIGETVLDVKGLCRPGVFEDVSFVVRSGEVLGFFGLVGAGRSELMRAVFGVDRYRKGEVLLKGRRLPTGRPAVAIRRGMGFLTEDRKREGLLTRLPILLNMTLVDLHRVCVAGFINRKKQREKATTYIDALSIKTPSLRHLAGTLSGGNQQKLVMAKWLMTEPGVLIVDEPTRGIDVGSKSEIYHLIDQLASQGMAIIVISSEIEEILGVCDRVVTVCEGRLTADLPVSASLSPEEVLGAALGLRPGGQAEGGQAEGGAHG